MGLSCPVCLSVFPAERIGEHVFRAHGGTGEWECGVCGLRTEGADAIAAHCLALRHDATRIQRRETMFASVVASIQHSLRHSSPAPKTYMSPRKQEFRRNNYEPRVLRHPSPAPKSYASPRKYDLLRDSLIHQDTNEPRAETIEMEYKKDGSEEECQNSYFADDNRTAVAYAPDPPITDEDSSPDCEPFVGREADVWRGNERSSASDAVVPHTMKCRRCERSVSGGKMAGQSLLAHVTSLVHGRFPCGFYTCSECGKAVTGRTTMVAHVKSVHEGRGRVQFTGDPAEIMSEIQLSFLDIIDAYPSILNQPKRFLRRAVEMNK